MKALLAMFGIPMFQVVVSALVLVLVALMPAVQAAPTDVARETIQKLVPKARIDAVEPAPLPGYYQVLVGGQLVYVSADGRYVLQGKLYDTADKRDLTGARLGIETRARLAAVPASRYIVFGPPKPKYKVTVFTDLDCGFCRKLHSQIAEYNRRGIEFDYLFFPRTGLDTPSYDKAVSVWCARDRKTAFTAAKAGQDPKPAKCDNPVAADFHLGVDLGVRGTPSIYAPDGSEIGGYLTPDQMLQKLQSLAAVAPAG